MQLKSLMITLLCWEGKANDAEQPKVERQSAEAE